MKHLPDALMVGGASGIAVGAWLIYPPAGFIVAGLLSLFAGIMLAKAAQ